MRFFHKNVKLLKNLDIFGYPISLSFKDKTLYKSVCGGFFTLFLIMLMVILTCYCFFKLFNEDYKESYKYVSRLSESFGNLNMSTDNFMLALKFDAPLLNNWDQPLLNISFARIVKNGLLKIRNEIPLVKCQEEFFPNLQEQFAKLGLMEGLCPEKNSDLSIEGNYDEEVFSYLQISVQVLDEKYVENTEIYESFRKMTKIRLNVYMINNNVDEFNIKDPLSRYIASEIDFFLDQHKNFYKMADIFLSELFIETDYGFLPALFDRTHLIKNYTYDKEFREQSVISFENITENTIADFYIRKSQLIVHHKRKLGNLLTILSYLGGIWSGCFLFLFFLIREYDKNLFLNKLANKLYSFPSQAIKNKKTMFLHNPIKTIVLSRIQNLKENKPALFIQKIKEYLYYNRKLKISFFEHCKFIFLSWFPFIRKHEKYLLLLEAKKTIIQDLDICNILRQLSCSQKMKSIFFDENQQKVFNFFNKPSITVDYLEKRLTQNLEHNFSRKRLQKNMRRSIFDSKSLSRIFSEKIDVNNIKIFDDLLQSYKNLKRERNVQNINEALVRKFIEEFSSVFDLSEQLVEELINSEEEQLEYLADQGLSNKIKGLDGDHLFEDIFVKFKI